MPPLPFAVPVRRAPGPAHELARRGAFTTDVRRGRCRPISEPNATQSDSDASAGHRWLLLEAAALACYLALAVGYCLMIPPGGGPDEREHADYVRALADHGRLPALPDSALAQQPERVQTPQAQHPPLYYLLMAPLHHITGGGERAFYTLARLLGALIGLVSLLLMRAAARMIFPDRPAVPALALIIGCGFGTYVYVAGTVNNEVAAALTVCAALYALAWGLQTGRAMACAALLGALLGLGLLVKLTATVTVVLLVVGAVALAGQASATGRRRAVAAARLSGVGLLVAAAVAGWWPVRNVMVYDTLLPRAHLRPLFDSPAHALTMPEISMPWLVVVLEESARGMWVPWWLLRRDPGIMAALIHTDFVAVEALRLTRPLPTLLALLGLLIPLVGLRRAWRRNLRAEQKWLLLAVLLGMAWLLGGLTHQLLLVDSQVALFIARYLPVMLPGWGMALAVGALILTPKRRQWALCWTLLAALAVLNAWTWWQVTVLQVHTL